MRDCNQGRFQQQIRFLRRQFLQDGGLPCSRVLSEEMVQQALSAVDFVWNGSIYTPMVTLWVFLGQVLSADHSCTAAVARLIAHRVSQGQRPCSPETSAYCQVRKRLPEKFFSTLTCLVGQALDAKGRSEWLWKGRRVLMFDGTTVSMPDTRQNQRAYPQSDRQKSGLGFPIARVGAITSLAQWRKPWIRGIYGEAQKAMPKFITVREARVHIKQPGFRTKVVTIVTTLLDPIQARFKL